MNSRSADTREALICAGLALFGKHGFEATSTRALAGQAGTNIASIAYHFGSKEGLRLACGKWVVERATSVAAPVLGGEEMSPTNPVQAALMVNLMVDAMSSFILTQKSDEDFVPFMLREITQPGAVFQLVYSEMFEPMHRRFCELWAAATGGEAESEDNRLQVFSLIGQLLYFRIGREPVLRRMGWEAVTQEEARKIAGTIKQNIAAQIDAARERNGMES